MIETKFKDTEIGVLPEEWDVRQLGTLCSIHGRIGFRGYTKKDLVKKHEGAITYSPSDIKDQILYSNDCDYISLSKYEESPEIKVYNGDILFCKTASIGKCAIVEDLKELATINPQFVVLKEFKCFNKYLYYILARSKFQERVKSITGGSTIPTMSQEKLKEQLVQLPTPKEQLRIASALTSIDNLISSLDKLFEKKKNIKQGTMQQLLTGKKRLKGFTEPWEQKYMWQVTTWDKKFNGVASYMQKDSIKYPYVLANVFEELETHGGNVLLLSTGNYVGWTTEEKAGLHLCEGEVVAIPWGGVANVKYANEKFVTADNRIATSADINVLDNKYLYYQMLFRSDEINSFYRGASIKHPSMLDVLTMILQIPSIKEQKAIASVLTSMDNELSALESKKAKYESLKQGMMQQLLTGKIRLI